MKAARIVFLMGILVLGFSISGYNQVASDPQIGPFFFVYVLTGVGLTLASLVEMIYQARRSKTHPVAKEQVLLPTDDTIE